MTLRCGVNLIIDSIEAADIRRARLYDLSVAHCHTSVRLSLEARVGRDLI